MRGTSCPLLRDLEDGEEILVRYGRESALLVGEGSGVTSDEGEVGDDGGNQSPVRFHEVGYAVYRGSIPVAPSLPEQIRDSNWDDDGLPNAPQGKDDFVRDGKRLQTKSGQKQWCQSLRTKMEEVLGRHKILSTESGEAKKVVKIRGLKSEPTDGYDSEATEWQVGDQGEHTDEPVKEVQALPVASKPLSILYAVEPGTRLRIQSLDGKWRVVRLEPGDMLVFRGDVLHHGMGYAQEHVRVHAYVYPPKYKSASYIHSRVVS